MVVLLVVVNIVMSQATVSRDNGSNYIGDNGDDGSYLDYCLWRR